MTKIHRWECFTYTGVAKLLGVAVWRIRYAVKSGYLPRPGVRFKSRAMFGPGQIDSMRAYFARADSRKSDFPDDLGKAAGGHGGSN
jgi:hypothetical protein